MVHQPSKVVVITGSTRGIGFGMAEAFLARYCRVVICGRTLESTQRAVERLVETYDGDQILGQPCDVRFHAQVQALWDAAIERFGRVDIWINNAGIGTDQQDLWTHDAEEIAAVTETNIVGTLYGCQVAMKGMLAAGAGQIYNMEGLGSDGRRVDGLTLYGTSKRAVRYLTAGLIEEAKGTPVIVGSLSPGMVTTDLLLSRYDRDTEAWERARRIFDILADRVETVAPWLVEQILSGSRHGVRHRWLTLPKLIWRFVSAPFRRRDVVS
jgi:NAD(P)-dependent dehydrogenase (short-subunit alcohol dehydrogenase family)